MTVESQLAPEPRRILVRGVNWLGDAVMTTPALQQLRARFPAAHIVMLTRAALAGLWSQHPSLNEVLPLRPGQSPWSVAKSLRPQQFDLALVFPNSPRAALEVWLAGIPHRIGYARPWRNWFLTQPIATRPGHQPMRKRSVNEIRSLTVTPTSQPALAPPSMPFSFRAHQMHEYLHLAGIVGADVTPLPPRLELRDDEVRAAWFKWLEPARQKLADPAADRPLTWIGMNPSAAYGPAKRWPADRFAQVIQDASPRIGNCAWILFGGSADRSLCAEICRHAPGSGRALNLAGETTLRELMALLKLCRTLVTNDSGPMHIAAALGTPVVVPFGSTSPELTGPGLPGQGRHQILRAPVPCAPCFRRTCPIDLRCLTAISPDNVVEAVLTACRGN